MQKNNRSQSKYYKFTFYILGFHQNGEIFWGKKTNSNQIMFSLRQIDCQLGQNKIVMGK
jgi:hypothetical protein